MGDDFPDILLQELALNDRHFRIELSFFLGDRPQEDFDMNETVPLKAGSYMKHPAKAVHIDGAKDEEVILQIIGIGPGKTTPVKP